MPAQPAGGSLEAAFIEGCATWRTYDCNPGVLSFGGAGYKLPGGDAATWSHICKEKLSGSSGIANATDLLQCQELCGCA